jgi:enamine deaminase RidA (YjgF/YER057c/UK114 family)
VFENLRAALASVGANFSHLVKVTVFLTDARYYEPMREIRARYLTGPLPTMTVCIVTGLAHPDLLVEIEGIAALE